MSIKDIRSEYSKGELRKENVNENPIEQFKDWFNHAIEMKVTEVNVMTFATVSPNGLPSARIVLLKEVDDKGFVFFTNYKSRKGKELDKMPHVALLFYWKELERQIRIEGKAKKIKRPENWGGYRVIPEKIEFWQGRTNRLHDRILYTKIKKGWNIERLEP